MSQTMKDALLKAGFNLSAKKASKKTPKTLICRKCGKPMENVTNTNVVVCSNEVCNNKIVFPVH